MKGDTAMKTTCIAVAALIASALATASFTSAASAHDNAPPVSKFHANNGYGQEKHGNPQDGENPGSNKGKGVPKGGLGAGKAGAASKQNGTGLR
jgi:hypothetical protein